MPQAARHSPEPSSAPLEQLAALEGRLRWLSAWTIHNANHLRESRDGLKVGGHQASCASMTTIMAALYFTALRPSDKVAVKPHASPVLHAIHYLLGEQSLDQLQRFRGLGGAQSYPSRTKDQIPVDFSTGSVGLGVAVTAFASLVQDYLIAHGQLAAADAGPDDRPDGRCGAGRGQHLRGPDRGLQARCPQLLVDRRLQSPVAGRHHRRPDVQPLRRHLRHLRLAGGDAEARQAAAGRLRRARRQRASHLDRHLLQRRVRRPHLPGRRRLARAPAGRPERRQGRRPAGSGAATTRRSRSS